MLDATEIVPGLWMGAMPRSTSALADFDAVVDLDGGGPGHLGILQVVWPIQDRDVPDAHRLDALCKFIAGLLRADAKVLVHCVAGLNRSGLVVGIVLAKLGVADPVNLIQAKRPGALANLNFVEHIREAVIREHAKARAH